MSIRLRAAVHADAAFVEDVYFTTQRWIIEQLFGQRGFEVERQKFHEHHDAATVQILEVDGAAAGWVIVNEPDGAIEIEGIYIAPAFQRAGIGTRVISDIVRKGESRDVPVRLSTAKINPARQLYERLGFTVVDESAYKIFMERPSPPSRTKTPFPEVSWSERKKLADLIIKDSP